ncbi:MAG: hypothetical protein H6624_10860 [Bdellovibrionaceae bacterium]|nr:hypothetical protein [Bdellovibrionales bacterium]MCB9084837.1 hypothetical protein [Pseudobdellovibrionaceae bacterium]
MQTTTWSAEEIRSQFDQCESLADVIRAIEDRLWQVGEVVCEIRVNGMFLDESDEERFAKEKLAGVERLEVKTQRPKELLGQTVTTAKAYIPKIKESSVLAAGHMQTGDFQKGHQLLSQILDSSRWLIDALFLIKKSCQDWAEVGVAEEEWRRAELQFADVVRTLYSAFESNDKVLLADYLEYEMSNALDKWLEVLSRVDKMVDEELEH